MKPETEKNKFSTIVREDQPADDNTQKEVPRNPTPIDLDAFLPWMCIQWQCSKYVAVKRVTQERYVSKKETSKSRSRNGDEKDKSQFNTSNLIDEVDVKTGSKSKEIKDTIQITTVYDFKGTLVEIAFHKQYNVPRKIIRLLNFCFPFHTSLTKFTYCDGELTSDILQEIAKMLQYSNITDLILNGNYVPQGNYYILLENTSLLKHISLSRCNLNDIACIKLITTLESGHSIQLLDLSFNDLTDDSAKAIGHLFRLNRTLLHLNLMGNKITTCGARAILDSLAEFPLTVNEIMDMKKRHFTFLENKNAIYTRCLDDARKKQSDKKSAKSHKNVARHMAIEISGEFNDPLNFNGTVRKNEYLYCKGNFVLCSLNISYNHLDYLFVKHLYNVLKYQSNCGQPGETGLMRVVIEGNAFPADVPEYILIDELLTLNVCKRSQFSASKNQKNTVKKV